MNLFTDVTLYYLPIYLILWFMCATSAKDSFSGHCLGEIVAKKHSSIRFLLSLLLPVYVLFALVLTITLYSSEDK